MDGLIAYALSKKYADEADRSILDAAFKTQVEQDRSILQTTGQEKILYFIPKTTAKPSDGYDEYVYSNNAWEQVGVTDVDLSFYVTKAEVGNLNNLPTTDKSSIVSAISETFTSVSNGKSLVASAITDKGVSTSSDATFEIMAQNIEAIPTGSPKPKTVNFYDFKGNLAHSYTAAETAELTELPEAPTIEGFTFQKWNWSLASIKTWITKHENDNCDLNVGGLYVTTDGHTRIYMHLREAELANLEMPFCIQQMDGTVVIDWGDDSQPETITAAGIYSHLWQIDSYPADVVIDIDYTPSGSTKLVLGRDQLHAGLFNAETYYAGCVEKVEYGNNNDFAANSATFKNCKNLKTINIPFGFSTISSYALSGCTNLALTALPDGVTSIGVGAFYDCTNLALTVLPDGVTSIGNYAFSNCSNLALTVLPDGITSIGQYAFQNCTNLALTVLPDGVTSIGQYAFQNCTNLALTALPDGITSTGQYAFQNCTNLALTALPDGVTSIGVGAFYDCTNLALTVLPDGVTSIGNYAFSNCSNLALTVLPDGITSIGQYAFQNCTSLYIIDLTAFKDPQSIPTLANANAFQGIPTRAQFWVANQEMYDAFTTATNWSAYASKFAIKGA